MLIAANLFDVPAERNVLPLPPLSRVMFIGSSRILMFRVLALFARLNAVIGIEVKDKIPHCVVSTLLTILSMRLNL